MDADGKLGKKIIMKLCAHDSRRVTRSDRCNSTPGKALLVCSDLLDLDLCDEVGLAASRGRRSLRDAVRDAERRLQRQREAPAAPL